VVPHPPDNESRRRFRQPWNGNFPAFARHAPVAQREIKLWQNFRWLA